MSKKRATVDNRHESIRVQRAVQRKRQDRRRKVAFAVLPIAVVVLVIGGLITACLVQDDKTAAVESGPAPAQLVDGIHHISAATYDAIGVGTQTAAPKATSGTPILRDGKPRVIYIGAEYCPFCADERWSVIAVLSRFGTWSNLQLSHSAGDDVHPNTPTFSFHGATFTSAFISFESVELSTNKRVGRSYAPLESMTSEQESIINQFAPGGGIPFVDFGNRYVVNSATYDPDVLEGKSHRQIVDAFGDPSSPISQAVLGSANTMTAALCQLTGNTPADLCTSSAVVASRSQLESTR